MYKFSILMVIVLSLGITACSNLSEKDLLDLQSSNQIVKSEAIFKVAEKGLFNKEIKKKAVPILVEMLQSQKEPEEIQLIILKALGDMGKTTQVPISPIIEALKDENPHIRSQAIESLGKIKDKKSVPALLCLLEEEPDKYPIIWSLGEIGDKRAIPALNQLLNSKDKSVQYNACKALKKIR